MRTTTRTTRPIRTLAVVTLATLAMGSGFARAGGPGPVCGDVNASGSILTTDALLLLKTAVGQPTDLLCVECSDVETWGNQDELPHDVHLGGSFLLGTEVKILGIPTVTRIGLISRVAGVQFQMALYTDDNGTPDRLVVRSTEQTLVEGLQEIVLEPTPIMAGHYWMVAVFGTDVIVAGDSSDPGSVVKYRAFPFGDPLPDAFGPATTATGFKLNYFARVVD